MRVKRLAEHLDNCRAQGKNLIVLVISQTSEIWCGDYFIAKMSYTNLNTEQYKREYINPIAAILKNYPDLRIVCIIEPYFLAKIFIEHHAYESCRILYENGGYKERIRYAIDELKSVGSNLYLYLDLANSAQLGWSDNFLPYVDYLTEIVDGTKTGKAGVDGFASNVAEMVPFEEPFIPDAMALIGEHKVRESRFYDWNYYIMEKTYLTDMRVALLAKGFPDSIGMLLDTSRNGWGGTNRPQAASTSLDINTWVDQSRIDRRYKRHNWCNQGTAGIGVRPVANPAPGIDAFVWVKPPGESDGISAGFTSCNESTHVTPMCNTIVSAMPQVINGAMSGAPGRGVWFQALFNSLLANAYPPL